MCKCVICKVTYNTYIGQYSVPKVDYYRGAAAPKKASTLRIQGTLQLSWRNIADILTTDRFNNIQWNIVDFIKRNREKSTKFLQEIFTHNY